MRNLRVKTIVITIMGLALVVAGMPGTAEAGVCSRVGAPSGCVNSKDVKNNNLKAADLKDEAGADFTSGQPVALTSADAIVLSVTITAPTPGRVIVSTSGSFAFRSATVVNSALCSITTGAIDVNHLIIAQEGALLSMDYVPFGATRGFGVAAGSTTFNLVCNQLSGSVTVLGPSLTAIFVPTAY